MLGLDQQLDKTDLEKTAVNGVKRDRMQASQETNSLFPGNILAYYGYSENCRCESQIDFVMLSLGARKMAPLKFTSIFQG